MVAQSAEPAIVLHARRRRPGDRQAIRLVLVSSRAAMRAILAAGLGRDGQIEVVDLARTESEAEGIVAHHKPDAVIVVIEPETGSEPEERCLGDRFAPARTILLVPGRASQIDTAELCATHRAFACCVEGRAEAGGVERMLRNLAVEVRRAGAAAASDERAATAARTTGTLTAFDRDTVSGPASGGTDIIGVGASTGGIEALQILLARFTALSPPTLVVQRIIPQFLEVIVSVLDRSSGAKVSIATHGQRLERGEIYFAPGDGRDFTLAPGAVPHIRLAPKPEGGGVAPNIDALFTSLAMRRDLRATGVLLTGIGCDGAAGLLAMSRAGHHTIAQDEASSAVFGKPRAAIALGAAREVLGLPMITSVLTGVAA